eukprot:6963107-Ditylum_brightwellii.AAC.1
MRWSKNVSNKQDAPCQIMLASMDANYDILLAFGLALEVVVDFCIGEHGEFVLCPGDKTTEAMKKVYYRLLKEHALEAPEFRCTYSGPLGTHSTRKFGMKRCRRNVYHKDKGNYRGCFKTQRRVLDRYCDTKLPWVDVKINVALCVGGLCAYKLKEGSGLTDDWISKYVCPSIKHVYGEGVSILLGKAVLCAIFDDNFKHHVSQAWCHLVVAEYNKIPSHHCLDD